MVSPKSQVINPFLQQELAEHKIATGVRSVLDLLQSAEEGNLVDQATFFEDMQERDCCIFAEMQKRKLASAQIDWDLKAPRDAMNAEKKAIKDLEDRIEDMIDTESLIFYMGDAIGHGFAAIELSWMRMADGFWIPETITSRPSRWFCVDQATRQQIRLRDNTADGVELIEHGWVLHEHLSKTGEPGTQGLFRCLALPYLFKNFAIKNWLRFCELYAVPIRVLFHNEKDEAKKSELLRALRMMGQNGVALLEGGSQDDFQTIDAATGEGQGFQNLIEWCDQAIAKAINGGTLNSGQQGSQGNYASAGAIDEKFYMIRNHDAKQFSETLTTKLLGSIIKLNGLNIRPKWEFDTQEPEDLALYADALPKLVSIGFKIPVDWAQDKLKVPIPEDGEEILATVQPPQLAGLNPPTDAQGKPMPIPMKPGKQEGLAAILNEPKAAFTPKQQVIEDLGTAAIKAAGNPLDTQLIRQAIMAATGPEDLEQRLAVLMREADSAEFSRVMEKSLMIADVIGFVHASE
jgi:phage gp29-like protein